VQRCYAVLAQVSPGCPPPGGRLVTCYSPVRHSATGGASTSCSSFDLHVLSTPPAFVLSQDQTLRKECLTSSSERVIDPSIPRSESTLKTHCPLEVSCRRDVVLSGTWARSSSRNLDFQSAVSLCPRGTCVGALRANRSGRVLAPARCEEPSLPCLNRGVNTPPQSFPGRPVLGAERVSDRI
jgi:hypothetical protein